MADPILPYRDENALEIEFSRQPNSVGRFPSGKQKAGLQSTRKALGNITNAGDALGPRKAVFAPVSTADATSRSTRTVDKDELGDDADARLDELVRGGLERPMGMVHDEQQATREVALMEVGAVDEARHRAGVLGRAAGLCGSVRGVEEARRRAAVDAVFSCPFDTGVERDVFYEREELVEDAEDVLGVLDDDLCNLGDVVLPS